MRTIKVVSTVATILAAGAVFSTANAATCGTPTGAGTDLLTAGSNTTLNQGALFTTVIQSPTGTGNIDSFVRSGTNDPCISMFNTGAGTRVGNDADTSPFTRDLMTGTIPVKVIGGIAYFEFLLDVNQTGANPLLSLEQIMIYQSNTAGLTDLSGASLRWDMDGASDVFLRLTFGLGSGSGAGDYNLYVPTSLFGAFTYVYLYSQFGNHNNNNDGFEEWAVATGDNLTFCPPTDPNFPFCVPDTNVPEPGSIALLGLGLLGLGLARGRKS